MEDKRRGALFTAIRRIVRPLALFLLRNSITYREFAELSKEVWVDAAVNTFGLRGRPTNTSRVALMTGLTRKEVKRLRDTLSQDNQPRDPIFSRPLRIVELWRQNPRYLDESGRPAEIPFDGADVSFVSLAREVGGDVPPHAILRELRRHGNVTQQQDGSLKLEDRVFLPTEESLESINMAGNAIGNLIDTLAFNLNPDRVLPARVQRQVYSDRLSRDSADALRNLAERRGTELLIELDDWLQLRKAAMESPREGEAVYAGLGIYYFEEPESTAADEGSVEDASASGPDLRP